MRSSTLVLLAFSFSLWACGGDGGSVTDVDTGVADTVDSDTTDATADVADVGPDAATDTGADVEEPTPENVVCRECTSNADCGPEGNVCLRFPTGGSFCGWDCTADADVCAEGQACTPINEEGTISQCVPPTLDCLDLCAEVECAEGWNCNPEDGACEPARALCESCTNNAQCGGEADLCLTYPDGESACSQSCDGAPCPDGYRCAGVESGTQVLQQCVPESLTCVDRCAGVTCEVEGERCDALTGECVAPGEVCAPCVSNTQCGGDADICIGLPGAECTDDDDCEVGEVCGGDGTCVGSFCGTDCSEGQFCPDGTACYNVGSDQQQCLPITLTCLDRCALVDCAEGFNCDQITGQCERSTVRSCGAPCESNAECGGPDDLCLAIGTGGQQCYYACGEGMAPCPIGYGCRGVFPGRSFCMPNTTEFECNECTTTACPEGEECYAFDGSCYPRPSTCTSDAECGEGAVCNFFDNRCEPVGVACDYLQRFTQCDFSYFSCTAPTDGRAGTCEEACSTDAQCPADRPSCRTYAGLTRSVCTSDPEGGAHTCGRLNPSTSTIGRPCTVELDPTDPELCPGDDTDLCLETSDPSIPSFCTTACDSDDECGGGRCADFGGASYCVPDACACLDTIALADGEVDLFGAALTAAGTSRCAIAWPMTDRRAAAGFDEAEDAFRMLGLGGVLGEPLQAATLFDDSLEGLRTRRTASSALALAADAYGVVVPPLSTPADLGDEPLYTALTLLNERLGGSAPDEATRADAAALPDEVESAVAAVVASFVPALDRRDEAFGGVDAALQATLYDGLFATVMAGESDVDLDDVPVRAAVTYRRGHALRIAMASEVLAAIESATWEFNDAAGASFSYDTPIGAIIVAGEGADAHDFDAAAIALLVDVGGDDTYTGAVGVNAGVENPFGVVIDVDGADTYTYDVIADPADDGFLPSDGAGRAEPERLGDGPVSLSASPRQGAGILGLGALYDFGAGRDTFESLRMSQGFGLLGVGVLVDDGGAADLELEAYGQGAGVFGVGVLITGDDAHTFTGVHGVQGFGGVGGVGVAAPGAGPDAFFALPGDPVEGTVLYYSGLTATDRNLSAAQGAGVGIEGIGSGGLGVLVDVGGDDFYEAGVGAQGFGHRHGAGLLRDADGADTYLGDGLVAGAAIGFGSGSLHDALGADTYGSAVRRAANAFGYGDDLGGGLFVDTEGVDTYYAGGFALGYGALNGAGVFVELAGDDIYDVASNDSFGRAVLTILGSEPSGNPRREIGTWGFFIDAAGFDSYTRPDLLSPPIGESMSWSQTSVDEADLPTFGGGVDGEGATGFE